MYVIAARRRRRATLLLSAALVVAGWSLCHASAPAAATGAAATASPAAAAPAINPDAVKWLTPRLAELTFTNPAVNPPLATTTVRVLVPSGYAGTGERYPVVLLLHGIGDTSKAWTSNQDGWPVTLETFTSDKDVIIVMPDAGQNREAGWYSDWYNGGAFGSPQWETYHLAQLMDYIDRSFPTRRDRNGRVVAGLSMGGFGAMSYAARHPDQFAGVFSFSGALDTELFAFDPGLWGDRARDEVRRRGHNPTDLADNLADTQVWFRIGKGLPGGPGPKDNTPGLEPVLWPQNELFARALTDAGVAHHYEAYDQGGHNWWHWQEGFELAWPTMSRLFATATPAPTTFRYKSIEPSFRIWDWQMETHRDVVEFLQLRAVTAQGLQLEGSGSVSLTTPRSYEPGRTYRISAVGPTASATPALTQPDSQGRLRFTVSLGRSHTQQQYTAPQLAQAGADPAYWQTAAVTIAAVSAVSPGAAQPPPAQGHAPRLPATGSIDHRGTALWLFTGAWVLVFLRRRIALLPR